MLNSIRKLCGYRMPRLGPIGWWLYRKYCNQVVPTELFPGIFVRMDLSARIPKQIFWHGIHHEPNMSRSMKDHCKGESIFFDIGANYGVFSFWVLSQCPKTQVYAFDPMPTCYEFMNEVSQKNKLQDRFQVVNVGLGDSNAAAMFSVDIENPGNSTFSIRHPFHNPKNVKKIMSYICRFDDWLANVQLYKNKKSPWICKIDVEGFELNVLKGMQNTLIQSLIDIFYIEVFPDMLKYNNCTAEGLIKYIMSFGYDVYDINSMRPIEHILIDKQINILCKKKHHYGERAIPKISSI